MLAANMNFVDYAWKGILKIILPKKDLAKEECLLNKIKMILHTILIEILIIMPNQMNKLTTRERLFIFRMKILFNITNNINNNNNSTKLDKETDVVNNV